jgi:serine/threonine protein kinase/cyclophilin family peptidyl-prolyl cis-trans isomerase
MSVFEKLSTFALRKVVEGAAEAVGAAGVGKAITGFLSQHFTDHSQRLTLALQSSSDRAWRAVEVALAGESLGTRLHRTEDRELRRQIRTFLDASSEGIASAEPGFRQRCLKELRAAKSAGKLSADQSDPQALAKSAGAFARFADAESVLDAERRLMKGIAGDLAGEYPNLSQLLGLEPEPGRSVVVVAVRYFFRRAVEEDAQLFQGLAFAKLESLGEAQEAGFAALDTLLKKQGERLEAALDELQTIVIETHGAVLDLQSQIDGQSGQLRQIGEAVQKVLEQHQLQRREIRSGDSLSIRSDGERELVKQLVARYRALPEGERRRVPALLNAVGKLEVVTGDFEAASNDFAAVATMVDDTGAQAEAHFNAYQAWLERRDWAAAFREFVKAVRLDGKRFATFPVGKYQPQRILGAGGFGVAYLCKHKYMDAQVVVKTLMLDALGRDADKVFTEAQLLRALDHPAVIRISDCGYADASSKSRPFLVMDYFEGETLEGHVKKNGTLAVEEFLPLARLIAEGLQAAHGKNILHRDVKPANVLVRKDGTGWQVKVIDFGLALRQKVTPTSRNGSIASRGKTLVGDSIAGTLEYAAPEQMGRRNEPVGAYSDVYGWAKTCCYTLFQTTQPLLKHWNSIPLPLARLLEKCLDEDPQARPATVGEVLAGLTQESVLPNEKSLAAEPDVFQTDFAADESPEEPANPRTSGRSTRRAKDRTRRIKRAGAVGFAIVMLIAPVVLVATRSNKPTTAAVKSSLDDAKSSTYTPGRGQGNGNPIPSEKGSPPKPKEPDAPKLAPALVSRVKVETTHGAFVIELDFASAPKTCAAFLSIVQSKSLEDTRLTVEPKSAGNRMYRVDPDKKPVDEPMATAVRFNARPRLVWLDDVPKRSLSMDPFIRGDVCIDLLEGEENADVLIAHFQNKSPLSSIMSTKMLRFGRVVEGWEVVDKLCEGRWIKKDGKEIGRVASLFLDETVVKVKTIRELR